jgi:pimeloyl-ACP methyl ester carboxylesterase
MSSLTAIREKTIQTQRHSTYFLEAGPEDGPLIIFVHGWPERSWSWRHQLPFFASLGFHVVAPDMRGYGNSGIYSEHSDYRQDEIVTDMIELIDKLGYQKAVWVGHDWGSPVVWNIASHYPERCYGVANLCVPYATVERGIDTLIELVDRSVYPENQFPAGQWEYMRFYEENFDDATSEMDANPLNTIKALFQKRFPDEHGKPATTAFVRKHKGWFEDGQAPDIPIDTDIIDTEEIQTYAASLTKNGFFGPNSWYMNHAANAEYWQQAKNNGVLDMPTLFIAAKEDHVCLTTGTRLGEPMREKCRNLTEAALETGHWMAQEKPAEVNRELIKWLVKQLPELLTTR